MRSDESEFITYEMGTMLMPAALISSVLAPERSMSSNLFLRLTDSANAAFSSLREPNCLIFTIITIITTLQNYKFIFISAYSPAFYFASATHIRPEHA